ncbi:MAG: nicotinate phosphoribosyltransferase [Bacteroidia bacterium]|nr:nicotinate phosphoribosyltransferase [Bacteroidia bacterium]MDW8346331.1 nicotinate phosphoribosyltransferase [Bacteroidia bacterium]
MYYGLLTDLYQLTMGYGYWKTGKAEQTAVFNLFFRKLPFKNGYAVAAGLSTAVDFIQNFKYTTEDIQYLSQLKGNDGEPLFEPDYLDYLANLSFTGDIDAVEEGEIVFPHQPMIRVTAPLIQAQLIETGLLCIINFQTLIATKASRLISICQGDEILEFGLRRAQGIDGALAASRAAYIGGCHATSNVLAGKMYGIPVKGTHAHAWVMAFDTELEAFEQYAKVLPNNCVFLVDTYDTIEGVKNAIKVGHILKQKGYTLAGIRLDSGDLAFLSKQARQMLDEAGFTDTKIVASNDLDEYVIADLKKQGAVITVWGVGTNLVTAKDQPALGGVYKLGALWEDNQWKYKIKISEIAIKISNPGIQQVRRFYDENNIAICDMLIDQNLPYSAFVVNQENESQVLETSQYSRYRDLLIKIIKNGKLVYDIPNATQARDNTQKRLSEFSSGIQGITPISDYFVGLEQNLYQLKKQHVKVKS